MHPPVAFDLTRLFMGPIRPTPRGIDRIDLGLASHFINNWEGKFVGTLLSPMGARAIRRSAAKRLVNSVSTVWGEAKNPETDEVYRMILDRLAGRRAKKNRGPCQVTMQSARKLRRLTCGLLRSFMQSGGVFGSREITKVPPGAVYLNTGQVGLASKGMLSWLDRRPDVPRIFMLHDTIPIDHPEYVMPLARHFHGKMIANTARYADGLIVTTNAVQDSVGRALALHRDAPPLVLASHLPLDTAFANGQENVQELDGHEYLVVLGAIEPRKNHLLLLDVWKQIALERGSAAPKLVIAGPHSYKASNVTDAVEQSEQLRELVIIAAGLSTAGLRRILKGAQGLLMPSFAEGFGLPIIEALACGTPVIASDLPAHREVGGNFVTFLAPHDVEAWKQAILSCLNDSPAPTTSVSGYSFLTWEDYARAIDTFIGEVRQQHAALTASGYHAKAA